MARNLEALRTHRPNLAVLGQTAPDPNRVRTAPAAGGGLNLFVRTSEGAEVPYYGGSGLGRPDAGSTDDSGAGDFVDPRREVDELWAGTDLRGVSMVVLLGLGLGQELEWLLASEEHNVLHLVIIEADVDVFRLAI